MCYCCGNIASYEAQQKLEKHITTTLTSLSRYAVDSRSLLLILWLDNIMLWYLLWCVRYGEIIVYRSVGRCVFVHAMTPLTQSACTMLTGIKHRIFLLTFDFEPFFERPIYFCFVFLSKRNVYWWQMNLLILFAWLTFFKFFAIYSVDVDIRQHCSHSFSRMNSILYSIFTVIECSQQILHHF